MQEYRWIARASWGAAAAVVLASPALAGESPSPEQAGSSAAAPATAGPPAAPATAAPVPAPSAPATQPPPLASDAQGAPAQSPSHPEPPPEASSDDGGPGWLRSLDLAAHLGVGVRLDDPPVLDPASRAGLLYGLGFDLFVSDTVSFGLHYEHLDLGEEGGDLFRTGTLRLTRDLNGLWIRVRAYPWRREQLGVYVALAGGPTWQSADAVGQTWSAVEPGKPQPFRCSGSDSVDVALRAAVGIDGSPSPPVRFFSDLGLDTYRLSDAVLDGCVPGAGTAAVFGVRAGIAYGIGL